MKSSLDFQTFTGRKWVEETTQLQIQTTIHRKGTVTQEYRTKHPGDRAKSHGELFPDFEF